MILTTTELERRNTLFQPRMNRQLLFGSLNPPSNVTPDTIYQYLLEYYGFDDTSRVYSNLWAQQIAERGNSWENFYNYFSRMGLSPKPVQASAPEPFYTEDNEMAVGGMVMNRWKQLGVHNDYYVLSPMYEKARSMGYQAFVNYFNSISDAEFLRDSGLPAGVDWTQPKPTTVKKKQPNLLPYIIAGVAIASQIF